MTAITMSSQAVSYTFSKMFASLAIFEDNEDQTQINADENRCKPSSKQVCTSLRTQTPSHQTSRHSPRPGDSTSPPTATQHKLDRCCCLEVVTYSALSGPFCCKYKLQSRPCCLLYLFNSDELLRSKIGAPSSTLWTYVGIL